MINDILCSIAEVSSRKDKEALLAEIKGSSIETDFKTVAAMAYSQHINFFVKEYPLPESRSTVPQYTIKQALDLVYQQLALKKIAPGSNDAINFLTDLDSKLSEDDASVLYKVIKRDLRAGISAKTINKVWPDLIYIHPYKRCSSFSKANIAKVKLPCFSQTKMDGEYIDIIVCHDEVSAMTRYGSLCNNLLSEDAKDALKSLDESFVLMGEAVALDEHGVIMDRASSNGYLNSDEVDPSRVVFYLWDMVSLDKFLAREDKTPYKERYANLLNTISGLSSDSFRPVSTVVCDTVEDIIEHFKKNVEAGEEGTVVKDFSGKWFDGTSTTDVKVKIIFECDLKVVGYNYGEKGRKYENMLGNLICETSDGKIRVSPGSGFKDEERQQFINEVEDWISTGKIVTVRANDITLTEDDDGKLSLFLPRFVTVRNDKDEADSYERVIEQRNSVIDIIRLIQQ